MPKITIDWLVGFVEGEGCFTVMGKFNNTTRQGQRVYYRRQQPQFLVAQKGRFILDQIALFLAEYGINARVWPKRKQDADAVASGEANFELRVCGYANCRKLIPLFKDRLLIPYKRKQFENWTEQVLQPALGRVPDELIIREAPPNVATYRDRKRKAS